MKRFAWGLVAAFCIMMVLYFLAHPVPPGWMGEPIGGWPR